MENRIKMTNRGLILVLGQVTLCALTTGSCSPDTAPVCVDCFDRDGYQLDFSALPSGTKPAGAVLFSGWRNGRCQNDVVCTATPDVFLGDVRWGPVEWSRDCDSEDQEVIAFAGGQQPFIATPDLPPDGGVRLSGTAASVALTGPLKLDVRVWVVGDPLASQARRDAEIRETMGIAENESLTAARIYAQAGAGLDLSSRVDSFPSKDFTQIDDLYRRAGCGLVTALDTVSKGYDAKSLNVYYVGIVQGDVGRNCYAGGSGVSGQNIVFVIGSDPFSEFRLAHELGHALGLLHSGPLPGGGTPHPGHVDEMYLDTWLAADNLMDSGPEEVTHLTLGQIYRLHYDKLAWHWRRPDAPDPANGYPRECQNSPVAGGPCPPLTLHPTRGWE
jgi:hypothetical protein